MVEDGVYIETSFSFFTEFRLCLENCQHCSLYVLFNKTFVVLTYKNSHFHKREKKFLLLTIIVTSSELTYH